MRNGELSVHAITAITSRAYTSETYTSTVYNRVLRLYSGMRNYDHNSDSLPACGHAYAYSFNLFSLGYYFSGMHVAFMVP